VAGTGLHDPPGQQPIILQGLRSADVPVMVFWHDAVGDGHAAVFCIALLEANYKCFTG